MYLMYLMYFVGKLDSFLLGQLPSMFPSAMPCPWGLAGSLVNRPLTLTENLRVPEPENLRTWEYLRMPEKWNKNNILCRLITFWEFWNLELGKSFGIIWQRQTHHLTEKKLGESKSLGGQEDCRWYMIPWWYWYVLIHKLLLVSQHEESRNQETLLVWVHHVALEVLYSQPDALWLLFAVSVSKVLHLYHFAPQKMNKQ